MNSIFRFFGFYLCCAFTFLLLLDEVVLHQTCKSLSLANKSYISESFHEKDTQDTSVTLANKSYITPFLMLLKQIWSQFQDFCVRTVLQFNEVVGWFMV